MHGRIKYGTQLPPGQTRKQNCSKLGDVSKRMIVHVLFVQVKGKNSKESV